MAESRSKVVTGITSWLILNIYPENCSPIIVPMKKDIKPPVAQVQIGGLSTLAPSRTGTCGTCWMAHALAKKSLFESHPQWMF